MKKKEAIRASICLVHKVNPRLLPLMCISQMISSAVPFINMIYSSLLIDELVAGNGYEKIFTYAIWMVLLSVNR